MRLKSTHVSKKKLIAFLRRYRVEISLFLISFLIYHFSYVRSGDWYKHYVYQADAFIHGRLDLQGLPAYYHDVVEVNGKIYMPFPPMPAIILVPFVGVFGTGVSQRMVANFIGALDVTLLWCILRVLKVKSSVAFWLTILFGFGTVHWYSAQLGTTWFYASIVAVFFLLCAVYEALTRKRPLVMGLFLGFAALSRQMTVFSLPFFILVLAEDRRIDLAKLLKLLLSLGFVLSLYALYNYVRVGAFFDTTYFELYKLERPLDWQKYGIMDLHWAPGGLYTMLLMPPEWLGSFPFFKPNPEGMSMLLVTPAFLYVFKARRPSRLVIGSWISTVLIAFLLCMHFSHGWVQFGYRFSLDFTPFLMLLLAEGFQNEMSRLKIGLIIWSVVVNAWGVCWGNALGW
jgi:hypothetical protein